LKAQYEKLKKLTDPIAIKKKLNNLNQKELQNILHDKTYKKLNNIIEKLDYMKSSKLYRIKENIEYIEEDIVSLDHVVEVYKSLTILVKLNSRNEFEFLDLSRAIRDDIGKGLKYFDVEQALTRISGFDKKNVEIYEEDNEKYVWYNEDQVEAKMVKDLEKYVKEQKAILRRRIGN
jgi:hypothetical protein